MINPYRGEVALKLNGQTYPMRLTLGALAALEHELGAASFAELLTRFDRGGVTSKDLIVVLHVGLVAGGAWRGTREDLCTGVLDDGLLAASRAAAQLFWHSLTMEMPDMEERHATV